MDAEHISSRLRHRLTLQQPILMPDGAGGYARTWQNVADLWAKVAPYGHRDALSEQLADQKLRPRVTHRVSLRWRSGVTTDMRLLFEGRALNIRAVIDVKERGEMLEILAEEGGAG